MHQPQMAPGGPKGLQKGRKWCGWCVVLLHLLRIRRREKLSEPFGNAPARRAARKKKNAVVAQLRPQWTPGHSYRPMPACASHYPGVPGPDALILQWILPRPCNNPGEAQPRPTNGIARRGYSSPRLNVCGVATSVSRLPAYR